MAATKEGKKWVISSTKEVSNLGYLHIALYETLRLCPPAPFLQRISVQSVILPCGHQVNKKTKVLLLMQWEGWNGFGEKC